MEKCTEAFKMIILRLSECNCMECQDTFYHLDKCGEDMALRNSLIVLGKVVHMFKVSVFLETVCRTQRQDIRDRCRIYLILLLAFIS